MSERNSAFAPSQLPPEGAPEPDKPSGPVLQGSSPGGMLRQLREAAGVDPALVASAMKVSLQKLDALENDRFDELPDLTFARGLASAICRAFGADPAPVLERMPLAAPGLRAQGRPINQPFRQPGDSPAPMLKSSFSKPLMIAIGVLLLAAAALWLLPTLPIQLTAPAQESTSADGEVQEPAVPAAEPTPPAEMPAGAASAEQTAPAAPQSAASGAEPTVAEGGDLLVFTANAETWLTVRDAQGKQLINRTLTSGETVKLTGELPLSATVGRKDAVSVKVRGEPFDIKALSKTTVARFQVK